MKMAAALAVLLVATAATGLLLFNVRRDARSGAAPPASSAPGAAAAPRLVGDLQSDEARIQSLARERSATARVELVRLYAELSADPRRAGRRRTIVHEVIRAEEPLTAIEVLATAVAGDPTPLEGDELTAEIGRAIVPLWRDQALFSKGRDMLRLVDHDKARALLAASLTERADKPPHGLVAIEAQERQELASDLIQINMHTANAALKAQTLKNVDTIAGPEVSEVLADPANAHNSRAAKRAIQAQREAAEQLRVPAPE